MINALVADLSESLIDEIVAAVGLPATQLNHWIFWRLFRKVTDRLAYLGTSFDDITRESGLPAASKWALTHFCSNIQIHGAENIPDKGPLVVLSNHPGAYDALVIFSNLKGHTIRCVSSKIPFLNLLPSTGQHFLFAPRENTRERMVVLRMIIRHLQDGGTLNYFGSGHLDPDPTVYPGADRAIDHWLEIFDFFFKNIKNLKVLPTIVSGVISAKWVKHPITWLRKKQIDKQRLAEFGQVITQLRNPGRLMLTPSVSFGAPFTEDDLRQVVGEGELFPAVIERAKALFRESSAHFGAFLP